MEQPLLCLDVDGLTDADFAALADWLRLVAPG
jgi:hypothetical protein